MITSDELIQQFLSENLAQPSAASAQTQQFVQPQVVYIPQPTVQSQNGNGNWLYGVVALILAGVAAYVAISGGFASIERVGTDVASAPTRIAVPTLEQQPVPTSVPQVVIQTVVREVTAVPPPATPVPAVQPTAVPSGITLGGSINLGANGVSVDSTLSLGNDAPVVSEVKPTATQTQAEFVASFEQPKSNAAFVGCLPGRSCTPSGGATPWPTAGALPQPGDTGFAASFK